MTQQAPPGLVAFLTGAAATVDWKELDNDAILARYIARELTDGVRARPLFTRLVDMGVAEERARDAITRVRELGPTELLRRQRPARRGAWALALAMIVVGALLVVASGFRVDVDDVRWPTFAMTGAGILLAMFGLTLISR